jgi:hypothetical protein
MRRREVLQARVSDLFIDPLDAWDATTRFASSVITAGVANLVSTPLVEDDFDAVRALREPMADLVDRLLRVSRGGTWTSDDPASG